MPLILARCSVARGEGGLTPRWLPPSHPADLLLPIYLPLPPFFIFISPYLPSHLSLLPSFLFSPCIFSSSLLTIYFPLPSCLLPIYLPFLPFISSFLPYSHLSSPTSFLPISLSCKTSRSSHFPSTYFPSSSFATHSFCSSSSPPAVNPPPPAPPLQHHHHHPEVK